ncbi:MAG: VanZ family protein [Ginsengibacter sp.]
MNTISFKKFVPGIAWFFIIMVLTCLPGSDIPKIGWLNKIYFDKWVHVGMFGILVFLFSFPFFKSHLLVSKKVNYFLWIFLIASFWGLAIEFIQKYFVIGRSFDLLDWAADSAGAFVSFLYCRTRIYKKSSTIKI